MRAGILLLILTCSAWAADDVLGRALSRLSEEAEVFRANAPRIVAREHLVQRSLKPRRRFVPRVGEGAVSPKPEYWSREIVSEYAFAGLKDAPEALHEFRQIVSVDGRQIASADNARETLVAGLRSDDDRVRKRMLERFEAHGLRGAATDFGQILLLFTRTRLPDYEFAWAGSEMSGQDAVRVLAFKQRSGDASVMIVDRRKAVHQPLEGRIWIRQRDLLPLRIALSTVRKDGQSVIRDEATVQYVMSPLGYLAPASVLHRELNGSSVVVENRFEYSAFQMFKADTEVKFSEADPTAK